MKPKIPIVLMLLLLCTAACTTSPATRPATKVVTSTIAEPDQKDDLLIRPLDHADATAVAAVLHDLLGVTALVAPKSNSLVIKGPTEQLRRADAILDKVDVDPAPSGNVTFFYHLKNANAEQLAATMQQVFDKAPFDESDPAKGYRSFVVPDPRTNSLLVGSRTEYVDAIKSILGKLDNALPAPATKPAAN